LSSDWTDACEDQAFGYVHSVPGFSMMDKISNQVVGATAMWLAQVRKSIRPIESQSALAKVNPPYRKSTRPSESQSPKVNPPRNPLKLAGLWYATTMWLAQVFFVFVGPYSSPMPRGVFLMSEVPLWCDPEWPHPIWPALCGHGCG